MDMSQMRFVAPGHERHAAHGGTTASTAIQLDGPAVRAAAATAKQALLGLASTQLGVAGREPHRRARASSRAAASRSRTAQLLGGQAVQRAMPASYSLTTATGAQPRDRGCSGDPARSRSSQYKLVGTTRAARRHPGQGHRQYTYVHNIRVPGMLHGRVVRPRGQGALRHRRRSRCRVDESSIKHIPGAQVVRKGDFLGVVAPKEYDAIQAAAQLKVKWADPPQPRRAPATSGADAATTRPATRTADRRLARRPPATSTRRFASAAKTVTATYTYHYNGHVPIGPSAAVADVKPDGARDLHEARRGTRHRARPSPTLLGLAAERRSGVTYYEGSSALRRRRRTTTPPRRPR